MGKTKASQALTGRDPRTNTVSDRPQSGGVNVASHSERSEHPSVQRERNVRASHSEASMRGEKGMLKLNEFEDGRSESERPKGVRSSPDPSREEVRNREKRAWSAIEKKCEFEREMTRKGNRGRNDPNGIRMTTKFSTLGRRI